MKLSPGQLKEKWDKYIPELMQTESYRDMGGFVNFAIDALHWHHNIEDRLANKAPNPDCYVFRNTMIKATVAWLWEVMQRIEANQYEQRSCKDELKDQDEITANNLRVALETYEANGLCSLALNIDVVNIAREAKVWSTTLSLPEVKPDLNIKPPNYISLTQGWDPDAKNP